MQCALKRFGPPTNTSRPINTEASKEFQDNLAKMKAEREKQDKMWDDPKQNTITNRNEHCSNSNFK
jgi:hypothetical protein